ncbi:MAG: hypothetical protein L0196_07585 [candidate division Zixibacteria bacterium]|nr:hypothetical protein [candidate division Zixibacteria bacterium]
MQNQKPKELADDLAYLEILLEKILEMVEKGSLELKAADALKTIELKHKLFRNETSKDEILRPFLEMLERAGKSVEQPKEVPGDEKS